MNQKINLCLREARPDDWLILRTWITRPEIQKWWGSPNSVEAEIRIVFETPSAIARIIEHAGVPIGYCHAIDATHWGDQLPDGVPPGTWDIDLVVAEPASRGKGFGGIALDLLADEVFSTTLALALGVVVSVRNEHAVRAYERAGFKWLRVWQDPEFGAAWFMLRERPGSASLAH